MIMLYCLTHVDYPDFSMVIEHIVLGEIGMHKAAHVIHAPHNEQHINVALL